jgi:crotonobetainyl-CoA:carnitine CoA-transferase CaiB-like acyl-CoA transferase
MLNAASVPCGPIYSIDQGFADPQVKHIGMAVLPARRRQSSIRRWCSRAHLLRKHAGIGPAHCRDPDGPRLHGQRY